MAQHMIRCSRTVWFVGSTCKGHDQLTYHLHMPPWNICICTPPKQPVFANSQQICTSLSLLKFPIEGVLDYGDLGRPSYVTWAGLMGRKDTRRKTFPRVRMGLSLAWKASLACGYEDSFPCKPILYNPSPLRCLYKPEGLVRRGNHNHTG